MPKIVITQNPDNPRRYQIRKVSPEGSINTIGKEYTEKGIAMFYHQKMLQEPNGSDMLFSPEGLEALIKKIVINSIVHGKIPDYMIPEVHKQPQVQQAH